MHAIEFETVSHQHTIRLPDSAPDGVSLRVLLLSRAPLSKPVDRNLKAMLASVVEGMTGEDMTGEDIARPRDLGREAPEWAS